MLHLLALEIPSPFLWSQQIVFIAAFNHFPLPIVMCSLFPPWIPLCICPLLPFFLLPHCFSLSPYYETEEEADKGGRWRTGLKMQIEGACYTHLSFCWTTQTFFCFTWRDESLSAKEVSVAAGHAVCFADEALTEQG